MACGWMVYAAPFRPGEPPRDAVATEPKVEVPVAQSVLVLVLDAVHGQPAAGVAVRVERTLTDGVPTVYAGSTDEEGSWTVTLPRRRGGGNWHVAVDTGAYFTGLGAGVVLSGLVVAVLPRPDAATHRVTVLATPAAHAVYVGR
jgi:5-hydroxyisourate hydrolase-like protein (transthyretin family)